MPQNEAVEMPQTPQSATTSAPTPPYVGPLSSLHRIRLEAARLYKAARQGHVPAADASRLASVLALVAKLIEGSDLEQRIAKLEAEIAESSHE